MYSIQFRLVGPAVAGLRMSALLNADLRVQILCAGVARRLPESPIEAYLNGSRGLSRRGPIEAGSGLRGQFQIEELTGRSATGIFWTGIFLIDATS